MTDILKLFEAYNLIEVIGVVGEPDCRIRMFTSMQFSLSETQFRQLAESTAKRMAEKSRGSNSEGYGFGEDGEEDE